MKKEKIAFLDRDGTINKDYLDNEWKYVKEPELLTGTIKGLKLIQEYNYKIIIITNQYIIADGIITLEQYKTFNEKLINILKQNGIEILKVYCCPHNDLDNCNCKKPKTCMIDRALNDFEIDLSNSFCVGDNYSDYELSQKFNLDFYGIKGINNNNIFKYNSLYDVIIEREGNNK